MGLTGQAATVDELLTARENLAMIGRLAGLPRRSIRPIGDDLLERFSLVEAADRVVKTYSGGMRRRLDLAVSLIAAPPVLFLDEPTTGLDPRSRNDLWDVLRGLVAEGTTLLLTTQYLEEADQLCDDIVVIDRGRVIASGTPTGLKDQAGRASVVLTVAATADFAEAERLVRSVAGEVYVETATRRLTAPADGLRDMTRIAARARRAPGRRRRPRPDAPQPRRRVPAADRPPGRGRPGGRPRRRAGRRPRPDRRRRPDTDRTQPEEALR